MKQQQHVHAGAEDRPGLQFPASDGLDGSLHTTDTGNAERLVRRYGGRIRYVKSWGWMIYDGIRWQPDECGQIMRFAIDTARSIHEEAAQAASREERTALQHAEYP